MRANVKFNIVDEINHITLTHAFATLCGESLTSGNTGKWIGLNVKANMCEKCEEACRELITTLQACIAGVPVTKEWLDQVINDVANRD